MVTERTFMWYDHGEIGIICSNEVEDNCIMQENERSPCIQTVLKEEDSAEITADKADREGIR